MNFSRPMLLLLSPALIALVLIFSLLLLAGCPLIVKCNANEDCNYGQYCMEGACIQERSFDCITDSDCDVNEVCADGKCLGVIAVSECDDYDVEADLMNVQKQFYDGICGRLPEKMTFLDPNYMYGPVLKATETFDFDITTGYKCALAESAQVYGEVKYPEHLFYQKITVGDINYFQCVKPNIDTPQGYADDWRYCVLPFIMDSYIEGELVAQEKGSIDLWFKGYSLEKTIAAGNTYPFDDMERVSCEVNLDKECPEVAFFCSFLYPVEPFIQI
ncbi:MAG: hypothetical protein AABW59_05650 [archaeon]